MLIKNNFFSSRINDFFFRFVAFLCEVDDLMIKIVQVVYWRKFLDFSLISNRQLLLVIKYTTSKAHRQLSLIISAREEMKSQPFCLA